MTVWEVIEEVLAHKRKKVQWLADEIGATAQVMTNWKARNRVPPARYREIAEALGITVDQLEGLHPLPWARHEWPFPKIPFARWDQLDEADKGYVQRMLMDAIDKCYAGTRPVDAEGTWKSQAEPMSKQKQKARRVQRKS